METVAEHVIESDVAAPPPRAARLPLSVNLLILAACLLFALFIYGGVRALLEGAKLVWVAGTGRTVAARIIEVQTEPSSVKGQPPRPTAIHYAFVSPLEPTRTQSRWERLDREEDAPAPTRPGAAPPPAPQVGDTLPVRCALWLGRPLAYPWTPAAPGRITFLLLSGGLIIAISLVLGRKLLDWRGRRLRLLRHGVATVGTVIHKEARAEDAPRYYVRYGYAAGEQPREREEQVSIEQWKSLEVGQPVTVLYDPDSVEDAGLYSLVRR